MACLCLRAFRCCLRDCRGKCMQFEMYLYICWIYVYLDCCWACRWILFDFGFGFFFFFFLWPVNIPFVWHLFVSFYFSAFAASFAVAEWHRWMENMFRFINSHSQLNFCLCDSSFSSYAIACDLIQLADLLFIMFWTPADCRETEQVYQWMCGRTFRPGIVQIAAPWTVNHKRYSINYSIKLLTLTWWWLLTKSVEWEDNKSAPCAAQRKTTQVFFRQSASRINWSFKYIVDKYKSWADKHIVLSSWSSLVATMDGWTMQWSSESAVCAFIWNGGIYKSRFDCACFFSQSFLLLYHWFVSFRCGISARNLPLP